MQGMPQSKLCGMIGIINSVKKRDPELCCKMEDGYLYQPVYLDFFHCRILAVAFLKGEAVFN